MDPRDDGVTHVNIYSKGSTAIGRFLSNFADCHVNTEDGYFRTIEGYWYWLSTKHEPLRNFPGWQCKKVGRSLRGEDFPSDPDFQSKILKAIALKITSSEWAVRELVKTDPLPLYHYYVADGKSIPVKDGLWVVSFISELRDALKGCT
jgi:hypothetical protein